MVNAVYNIVDQIFIEKRIEYLGNAAVNIAFPLTTICMDIGLMVGLGGIIYATPVPDVICCEL